MSYQPGQPRHTAPLIARPATSRAAGQAGAGSSMLGNAIAGALGGMGMGMGQPPLSWHLAGTVPAWGAGGLQHPLPAAPHLGGYGQPFQPMYHHQQQPQSYPYPPPQQHFQQPYYPPQPPVGHPPRTTAEGYTISSAYVAPPPEPPSSIPQRGPNTGRGGGRGRGRGGDRDRAHGQARDAPSGGGGGGAIVPCSQSGCSFQGQRKAVREHEEDRHLIYAPGKEPKPWVGSYKAPDGVRIEGTSISLDSPEAIAKWIEERKKKWPSAKVVEVKETQRSERIAAGLEAPPRSGRGGRGGRGRGAERGGRGRGRGRGGTSSIWGPRDDEDETRDAKRVKLEPTADAGEAAASGSDSGPDDDDSDDDGPPVASSSKVPVEGLYDDASAPGAPPQVAARPTIHPSRLQAVKDEPVEVKPALASTTTSQPPKRKRPAPPAPPHNPFARPDPFARLAERDVAHVVSDVLSALEFFRRNDWLRGVEGRVGELDEEGGIEELPPSAAIEVVAAKDEPLTDPPLGEPVSGIVELDTEGEEDDAMDSGDELEISRNE